MQRTTLTSVIVLGFVAALGGCGGGGSAVRMPDGPFTSFSAIVPNQVTVMPGVSQTASGTSDTSGTILSGTVGPVDSANSTLKLTYDTTMSLSAISVATPTSTVSFSKAAGDTIACTSGVCAASNASGTASGVVIDATASAIGWNYQTFGVWDKLPTSTTWQAGAISAGAPTPASAVPTTGSATFTGLASGFYIDPAGTLYGTAASMQAIADFTNRSIGFSTSNTQVSTTGGTVTPNSGLNLSGSLSYTAGTNLFSGTVTTANSALSGTATGQFYGPNTEEIGGIYSLQAPTGVSGMLGGFGGKR